MKKFFTCLLLCFAAAAFAQKGSVKGVVYDKANGEGLPFVNIKVDSTQFGATTDDQGYFSIPNLPVGPYTISINFVGYENQSVQVEVKKGQTANIKIFLAIKSVELQGVEINADKEKRETETGVSVTNITPMDIKRMPSIGGEADLAQYLQVLPGVISTGDQGGQIIIRGGTPVQTQFLLDGIPIYNPFHSIGLFSVYETDVIKNVDVYSGGFPAEYGSRTGAVVDVSTRDGNKKDFSGKVSVSPFMAHALLEIPVIKLKEESNTSASLILNTKISYLDESAKVLYPYAANGGLPYSFYDAYGKFSLNTGYGNKFTLSGFNFRDNADFSAANYQWNTFGVGANFLAAPRNSNLFFNSHVSYSQYAISLTEGSNQPETSTIGSFDIGMDFNYYLNKGALKYGLDVEGTKTDFNFTNGFNQNIQQFQNSTDLSAYFSLHKYYKKFVFDAGARLEYYGIIGAVSPEPRLSMKVNATSWLRFKMASGLYSQDIISTKNNYDVVDLFNGYITGTTETVADASGKQYEIKNMQRSVDAIFGIEADIPKNITLNIEPYYKFFWHLLDINQYKQFASDPDFLIQKGPAYGMDVLLKWQYKGLYLYGTYSLTFVTLNDGVQTYPPYYDRRHNVNLVAAYDFGKKRDWEVSARWNYGSSFPFTQTQSFYEFNPFSNGIGTNYTSTNGNLGIVYDTKLDAGRLPAYHRLDLEVKKIFTIKTRFKIELNASCSNVYDRQNIFYFDRVTFQRVNQLPILPSLGLSFSW
jgi:hypothetical protein